MSFGIWLELARRDLRQIESIRSSCEVNRLINGLCGERLPAIHLAHVDLAGGKQRPEQHGSGVCGRQHGLRLDPSLELFVQPLDCIGGARAAPLGRRQTGEGEEPIAGFLQTVSNGTVLEPPFADEGLAAGLDLVARRRVDHVVDRAPLYRHAVPHGGNRPLKPRRAVDDEELGPSEAPLDEIVEDGAPSLGALAAHALDRQQHLLAIPTHADDDEQRDGGRLAVVGGIS